MNEHEKLQRQVERQAKWMKKAEREKPTLMGQTVFIGTLGLLLVLPMVGGAYLGLWLDRRLQGYSSGWTLSMILLGVMLGAMNVYLFIKTRN